MSMAVVISTVWCLLIFIGCTFAIPAWSSQSRHHLFDRLCRGGLGAGALWVSSACILGKIRCYNAITLIALAAAALFLTRENSGAPLRSRMMSWPEEALGAWSDVLAWLGRSPRLNIRIMLRSRWMMRKMHLLANLPASTLGLLALMVGVIVLSFCSHLVHWNNVRLVHSDEYLCLLRARQLLLNVDVSAKPLLFPSLVSAISLLGSADPLHVVRSLAAVMAVLITLATGRVTFLLTHSLLASSAAMYCENVALLRIVVLPVVIGTVGPQPAFADLLANAMPCNLEAEAAIFFLLLWMAVLLKRKTLDHGVGAATLACGVNLAASSLLLLFLAPFVGMACIARRSRFLLLLGIVIAVVAILAWQLRNPETPIEALQYLPCILGLLAGLVVARLEVAAVWFAGMRARALVAAALVGVAWIWVPPTVEGAQALEYDSIARATNSIAHQFQRQRWSIAAPVEEFAEVYSLGDFQDLAGLVDAAASGDISRAMTLSEGLDDLFIFVEKTPFTPFQKEPNSVSFATLTDTTYRNYRSPAGRATLEVRALQLCEAYKKNHGNMTVFFEDENVRVYRLTRVPDAARTS